MSSEMERLEDGLLVSRGQALIGIAVTSTVLAIGTCGVRLMARRQNNRGVWWDDYSMIVAMVMGFVGMIFASVEATSFSDPIRAMQFNHLGKPWVMFSTTLAKISICFYFLRTIGRRRPWNVFLGVLILLLAVVNLAFALASNLLCRPLEKLWNPSVEGRCVGEGAELGIFYVQGGFAVFGFLFLAMFPVMVVRDFALLKTIRWPFYVLSICMVLSGVFSVVRTSQVSQIGPRGTFSSRVLLATIFDILTQNLAVTAANILPLGTIFSAPNLHSLTNLVHTSDNELQERSDARRSPMQSAKASTIFVIEGPRRDEAEDFYFANNRNDVESGPGGVARPSIAIVRPSTATSKAGAATSRPGTSMSVRSGLHMSRPGTSASMGSISRAGTSITAGGPPPPGVDTEALRGVIMRTISVEVVEESIDDVEREAGGLVPGGEDWRKILSGSPMPK